MFWGRDGEGKVFFSINYMIYTCQTPLSTKYEYIKRVDECRVCITLDSYTQARLCPDNAKTANKVGKIKVAIRGFMYGIHNWKKSELYSLTI